MSGKAPIVKEYKRAGSFFGTKGTRLLRVLTTFLTIGAGYYCLMYVPFDESRGDNMFSPIRRYLFRKRDEFFGIKDVPQEPTSDFKNEE